MLERILTNVITVLEKIVILIIYKEAFVEAMETLRVVCEENQSYEEETSYQEEPPSYEASLHGNSQN